MHPLLSYITVKQKLLIGLEESKKLCEAELPEEEWQKIEMELQKAYDELKEAVSQGVTPSEDNAIYHLSPDALLHIEWAGGQLQIRQLYEKAVAIYTFLCFTKPSVMRYWIECGLALQERLQYLEAIGFFEMAQNLEPHNPFPNLYLAECYVKMFDRESAREELEKARESAQEKMPENQDIAHIIGEIEAELRLQEEL